MGDGYKRGEAAFLIADEMSRFDEKTMRNAVVRFKALSEADPYEAMKDPLYLRDYWFMSAEDKHSPIRRCKRCLHFKVTTKKNDMFKKGICTKDELFLGMESYSADAQFRCRHYVCKDGLQDKYPVTRNLK